MLTTCDGPAVIDAKARYWSKIAIFLQLGGPRRNIVITFGIKKLEWCGYPMVKKNVDMFIRYDRILKRDGRTDGHRATA